MADTDFRTEATSVQAPLQYVAADPVVAGEPVLLPPVKEPVEKVVVTDAAVAFVAKASDIDNELDWDSTHHDAIVACINAKAEARRFIAMAMAFAAAPPAAEAEKEAD